MESNHATCENCNSWRKTGIIIIGGWIREEPKRRRCKQDGVCHEWTPFPMETEGLTSAKD